MFVIGLQQADADAELKVQITGNGKRITVADAGGDIEFALVSFFFPLQVVLAATCIETEEMSGECTAIHAFAQPVAGFQSAGKELEAVFIMVDEPPGEYPFRIQRPTFMSSQRQFQLNVRGYGKVEQQVCFQGE